MPSHSIGLNDLKFLADALCELDHLKNGLPGADQQRLADFVIKGHRILMTAAGENASSIYDMGVLRLVVARKPHLQLVKS